MKQVTKIISYLCLMVITSSMTLRCTEPALINTNGNSVGIESTDQCFYIPEKENCSREHIVCTSGKSFGEDEAIETIVGSSTGTPPHLEFSNYIGSRILKDAEPLKMGSGRRAVYCLGLCKQKRRIKN